MHTRTSVWSYCRPPSNPPDSPTRFIHSIRPLDSSMLPPGLSGIELDAVVKANEATATTATTTSTTSTTNTTTANKGGARRTKLKTSQSALSDRGGAGGRRPRTERGGVARLTAVKDEELGERRMRTSPSDRGGGSGGGSVGRSGGRSGGRGGTSRPSSSSRRSLHRSVSSPVVNDGLSRERISSGRSATSGATGGATGGEEGAFDSPAPRKTGSFLLRSQRRGQEYVRE